MRIRMKQTISGTRNGEEWPARGEIADIPTGEAQHLVASGIAEEVHAEEEPENEGPDDRSKGEDPDGNTDDQVPPVETATAPDTAEKRSTTARKTAATKPTKE
ncbi:hypothetical protein ACFWFI_09710 [Streptomyces sp. NPDC060209]|uniref:hypothetical protein n=1 Tax=Streptomyces sp. NPDC060209 TaxID=3347073 RepID=UPI0036670858